MRRRPMGPIKSIRGKRSKRRRRSWGRRRKMTLELIEIGLRPRTSLKRITKGWLLTQIKMALTSDMRWR